MKWVAPRPSKSPRPSGWVFLVAVFSGVTWGFFFLRPESALGVMGAVLGGLVGLLFGVWVYFVPGTSGPNEYGPDPLSG